MPIAVSMARFTIPTPRRNSLHNCTTNSKIEGTAIARRQLRSPLAGRPRKRRLPEIKSSVAPSISHGSTRIKVWAGSLQQEHGACCAAEQAGCDQRNHYAPGTSSDCGMHRRWRLRRPKGQRIGCIRWNWRNTGEKQRGNEDETAGLQATALSAPPKMPAKNKKMACWRISLRCITEDKA